VENREYMSETERMDGWQRTHLVKVIGCDINMTATRYYELRRATT